MMLQLLDCKALEAQIVEREAPQRLRRVLDERKQLLEKQRQHLATLLYISETGSLEGDGFGLLRGNGYHSLDRVTGQVRTVDFDDYAIPKNHPRITSGQIEVKNDFK